MLKQVQGVPQVLIRLARQVSSAWPCHGWNLPCWLLAKIHWKDSCWSWNSNPLATWCEKSPHLKRSWCWERLKAGEGDDRGWDGWMTSLTWWTWVWVSSGSWWWTGKPDVAELDTTEQLNCRKWLPNLFEVCETTFSFSSQVHRQTPRRWWWKESGSWKTGELPAH